MDRDAINPLRQTLEGTQVLVHAAGGLVVTEAGFDTEKFMNIKCWYSGSTPHCAVVVATIRGLKMQGGGLEIVAGKPRSNACITENVALVEAGYVNFGQAYISNTKVYGAGAYDAVICIHHADDGRAAVSHFLPLVL
ncbi:hypothetical protein Prudu_009409 [Prunus dulcis]|uniref:Uncharacterized protein n=1 Tax=Prunus dulcis TaxID=3755 RepID=A0A4Y1R646_PRUDU|nr:hypothetical protein Prudu_009409 [Prunus dulcis]